MRLEKTLLDRDRAQFITTLVHAEWLDNVIDGHQEDYKDWATFAAQLVLEVCVPEQRNDSAA